MLETLFKKLQALGPIKKRHQHICFRENIAKFLRTAFLWNTSGNRFCMNFKLSDFHLEY